MLFTLVKIKITAQYYGHPVDAQPENIYNKISINIYNFNIILDIKSLNLGIYFCRQNRSQNNKKGFTGKMAKVLLSIPDKTLKRIDEIKNRKKIKRNQFFIDAIENYFISLEEKEYFERKKSAVIRMKKTSEEIMHIGIKDWDPVAEIRKFRDTHADNLLDSWKEE